FGLKVRTPSSGLIITARNKLRTGKNVQVRFAGSIQQALQVPKTGAAAVDNRQALEDLVRALPEPERMLRGEPTDWLLWHKVAASEVTGFLERYTASAEPSFIGKCDRLRAYIRAQNDQGELTRWTVCL